MNENNQELEALNERHRVRMERKKAIIDAKIAAADKQIGIIIVNTGNGKGKTTASMGLAIRAAGNGMKVLIVQFIKGRWKTGESQSLPKCENRTGLDTEVGQALPPQNFL